MILNFLFSSLFIFSFIVLIAKAIDPVFITTLPSYQAGQKVLSTTNPLTSNGLDYETTVLTYNNNYLLTPKIGISLDYLQSSYRTTAGLDVYVFDLQIISQTQSQVQIELNRTQSTITLLNINYIVASSDSFLDISINLFDLAATPLYISNLENTQVFSIPYKTKSNTTHAVIVYSTIGLQMQRTSNQYNFQVTTSYAASNFYNISIKVAANNKLKMIRLCSINFQKVATDINEPYYIDMGIVTSRSGTIPDTSGIVVQQTGTIWTGMIDWQLSDANGVLNYDFSLNSKSFTIQSSAIIRSRTAFIWYRKQDCPDYYYLSEHICVACDITCLTCANPTSTGCLTCGTTREYSSTNFTCTCNDGYAEVGARQCTQVTCSDTCETCANLNQCGSCHSGFKRYLQGTECVCEDYRFDSYEIDQDIYCFPCHYTCLHCSQKQAQTSCTACNQDRDHRQLLEMNNTCQCMPGYYHNYLTVCALCHYSCSTCSNGNQCLTCNNTFERIIDTDTNLCVCNDGYYDNGFQEECLQCPQSCIKCQDADTCLSCPSSRQLTNGSCLCKDGYFQDLNNIQQQCELCHHSCQKCQDSTNCLSCNSYLNRYFENNKCLCPDYYYDDGINQECYSCHFACVTCTDNAPTSCLSCDNDMYRELSLNQQCICQNGYYQVNSYTVLCQQCYYTCETCSDSGSSNCITCDSQKFRISDENGGCICSDGYYDKGNQLCQPCYYRCLTCSSLSSCDTCDTSTRDDSNLAICECLDGFYDDGISQNCQPCNTQCLTCENGNNCTTCTSNKFLTTTNDCQCASGTFEPFCSQCSYQCEECITTANNCIKCNSVAKRYLSYNNVTDEGTCLCYDGFFSDLSSQQCLKCHYSCQTCTSYSNCDTCPTNRQMDGSYCTCLSQFYENPTSKNCLSCHYSCKECSSYSLCTQCEISNHRVLPSAALSTTLCVCQDGYYDTQLVQLCFACDTRCLKCISYPACTECDSSQFRYIDGTQCKCLDGYYENSANYQCQPCHYSCQTCDDSLSCLTCPYDRLINPDTYLCDCIPGKFNNADTNTCQQCSYPCAQCSNDNSICTNCLDTFTFSSANDNCYCQDSTFQQPLLQKCTSCMDQCKTCDDASSCLTCHENTHNRILSDSQCICKPNYHDQNGTLVICQLCHYSCQTCSNSYSCNQCQSNRIIIQQFSYCSCPIELYYDDGSNPVCIRCDNICLSCVGTASNCTDCSESNHRFYSLTTTNEAIPSYHGDCQCQQGFYDRNGEASCLACHYSCKTCVSETACSSCDTSKQRIFVQGPYCSCQAGYYDQTNIPTCQACDIQCLTCALSSNNCLTCPQTRQFLNDSNTCPCQKGLFQPTPPSQTCQNCHYSCQQCSSQNQCTLCPNSRILTGTFNCDCITHYYDVDQIQQCQQCSALCVQCVDEMDKCIQCNQEAGRFLFDNQCLCQDGLYSQYQDSGNINCLQCHHSCERCSSSSSCTSCQQSNFRVYNVISKICDCIDGYYDDLMNQNCSPCPFDCLTCSDALNCQTCPSQRQLTTQAPFRCQCISSHYQNGTNCQQCPPQCDTCQSLSVCLTCAGLRTLSDDNQCICPIKTYPETNSPNCLSCSYQCATCKSSLICTSCNINMNRYLSGLTCKCLNGYYDDLINEQCATCHYSCLTCKKQNECLKCDSTQNRVYDIGSKVCQCQPGYYQESQLCVKCHYSCKTCDGGTSSDCEQCSDVYNRQLNIISVNEKQCQCPTQGYFDNGNSLCAVCDLTCLTCIITSTTCSSCNQEGHFRQLNTNSCDCITGYYEYNSQVICDKCSHKCVTCQGSAQNCTECDITFNRLSVIPGCECQQGFYDDGSNSQCLLCNYRCSTCSDSLSCDSCDSQNYHRYLSPDTGLCECQNRYFQQDPQNSQCISCHYSCETCNHPSVCITCPQTRQFDTGSCLCKQKFYDQISVTQCQPCHYSCKDCNQLSECDACESQYHRVFDIDTLLCSCDVGFYDTGLSQQICKSCDSSCYTCTNSTHCQSCYPNTNATINLAISNFCICMDSMYQYSPRPPLTLIHLQPFYCQPCHYSCEKCYIQAYYCTQCDQSAYRTLNSQSQCQCNSGYYDDGVNELCQACYDTANCIKCYGQNIGQCMECKPDFYMLDGQCFSQCPNYYYEDNQVWKCKSCIGYCVQCNNQTLCQTCQVGFYIYEQNDDIEDGSNQCVDICPDFYYEDTIQCLPCISPCLRCTQKYVCLDCIEKYYLNIQCYPCHQSCEFCNGGSQLDCISCSEGYYLNEETKACRKATCLSYQYVHGVFGCYNCSDTFANSIECTSKEVLQCRSGFKIKDNACVSCEYISGYTVINGQCQQICGDGIRYSFACDDGNVLDGDGCSSSCTIQQKWQCQYDSTCHLLIEPKMTVSQVTKIKKQNKIHIILQMNVGIRLYTNNFVISFQSGSKEFIHKVQNLNPSYDSYSLEIQYFKTISNDKIKIKVKSPASPRLLQEVQEVSIDLQLQIELEVDVHTYPPAIFYSDQTRSQFSVIAYYCFMALHLLVLISIIVLIILRLKILTLIIQFYSYLTTLYIFTVFGLFNVLELAPQSLKTLQPFIGLFGTSLGNQSTFSNLSAVQYYGYTQSMVSIIIIQIIILISLRIVMLLLGSGSGSTQIKYIYLCLLFAFSYDMLLSCIYTFQWLQFRNSLQSSYSWGLACIIMVFYLMQICKFGIYSQKLWNMQNSQDEQSQHSEIQNSKKSISIQVQSNQKSQKSYKNNLEDPFDPFAEEQNQTQANIAQLGQRNSFKSQDTRTQAKLKRSEQSSLQSNNTESSSQFLIEKLYDLNPKKYTNTRSITPQQFYYIKVLHPTYYPVTFFIMPLFINIFAFISTPVARCAVLLVIQSLYLIFFINIQTKTRKFCLIKTISVVSIHLSLIIIALVGIVANQMQENFVSTQFDNYSVQVTVLVIVGMMIVLSIIIFIVSLIKSDEFRAYQLRRKTQLIYEKNLRRNRLRNIDGQKNIFGKQQQSSAAVNIFNRNSTDQYYEHTDTKINLRIDSIQNNQGNKRNIGLQIVDIEDQNPSNYESSSKNRLSKILRNNNISQSNPKIQQQRFTNKNFYSVENENAQQNSSNNSSPSKYGKIHRNTGKSSFVEYQDEYQDKKAGISNKSRNIEQQRNNTSQRNLQSTRIQQSPLRNKSPLNTNKQKLKINIKHHKFLSKLQKELVSNQKDNDRTVIVNKQVMHSHSDSRDNTLISDRQQSYDRKQRKKNYHKQLIPTHQYEQKSQEDDYDRSRQQEDQIENKSDTSSDLSQEDEQKVQQVRQNKKQQIEAKKQKKQRANNNKKYYQYDNRIKSKSKKKNPKLLKNKRNVDKTKVQHQQQIIPNQLKIQQKSQHFSSQQQSSQNSNKQKYTKVKDYPDNKELPKGIRETTEFNNQQKIKQAKKLHSEVKQQMDNIISNVERSRIKAKKSISKPHYKLKRIDSISSIGEQQNGKQLDQSEIKKQEQQQMSEEGNTVFKKILQDYQKYKHKKVRGNLLKKKHK